MSAFKSHGNRPAFPVECYYPYEHSGHADREPYGIQTANHQGFETGLTIRQWLAGMAIPAIGSAIYATHGPDAAAALAIEVADAIISRTKETAQ